MYELSKDQFTTLKNYCKIDQNFDDDVLHELIESAALELCAAIKDQSKPDDFKDEPRFFVAIMKIVKEDYDYRGMGSEVMRFPLANQSVINIINQLRSEITEGDSE